MTFIRREVRTLGGKWNSTILWYAKGVGALQQKPITDPESWWFLGAMHGFHPAVWKEFEFITDQTLLPGPDVQKRFWEQCQHQSWYFLPWHRGYLYAFEEIVRSAVVTQGGPADWALPYWNYSTDTDPSAREMPEEFAESKLPDGSDNPLFVSRRYGDGPNPITIDPRSVALSALEDDDVFTGGNTDIPPGFGGPVTTFHHGPESETTNGGLESLPHNNVHGAIGGAKLGSNPNDWWNLGLMSMPITAGLDPIFWLHHANIDRLWTIWGKMPGHANPTDRTKPADLDWLDGPGDRGFVMPLSGGREWVFRARDVLDTRAQPLNYDYDEEAAPVATPRVVRRLAALGVQHVSPGGIPVKEASLSNAGPPELIGASAPEVTLLGRTSLEVKLDESGVAPLRNRLSKVAAVGGIDGEPPRVFLKIEGIRGTADAAIYYVYIDLPAHGDPKDYPDRFAGALSLFGVSAASAPDGPTAGSGVNQVLEITDIVDALHLSGDDLAKLDVQFLPSNTSTETARVHIGRLSVFKLGA